MIKEFSADALIPLDTDPAAERERQYELLVRSYTGYLYRYALWCCHDPAQAEDLVQETFLRVWKYLDRLEQPAAVKGWLTRILRNELARCYQKRRPEVDPEASLDNQACAPERETSVETQRVRWALMQLPVKYRDPLLLQVLGGFDMAEVAALLELSKGAVMTRVFRARQKLRRLLEEESSADPIGARPA